MIGNLALAWLDGWQTLEEPAAIATVGVPGYREGFHPVDIAERSLAGAPPLVTTYRCVFCTAWVDTLHQSELEALELIAEHLADRHPSEWRKRFLWHRLVAKSRQRNAKPRAHDPGRCVHGRPLDSNCLDCGLTTATKGT